jgi:hypothetical protein
MRHDDEHINKVEHVTIAPASIMILSIIVQNSGRESRFSLEYECREGAEMKSRWRQRSDVQRGHVPPHLLLVLDALRKSDPPPLRVALSVGSYERLDRWRAPNVGLIRVIHFRKLY